MLRFWLGVTNVYLRFAMFALSSTRRLAVTFTVAAIGMAVFATFLFHYLGRQGGCTRYSGCRDPVPPQPWWPSVGEGIAVFVGMQVGLWFIWIIFLRERDRMD